MIAWKSNVERMVEHSPKQDCRLLLLTIFWEEVKSYADKRRMGNKTCACRQLGNFYYFWVALILNAFRRLKQHRAEYTYIRPNYSCSNQRGPNSIILPVVLQQTSYRRLQHELASLWRKKSNLSKVK